MKSNEEHRLQASCVTWFALQYPEYTGLLFAVPNGGARDVVTGAMLKAEGVTPGVADLLLLVPNRESHGLAIEMKTAKGRQQESQREWQEKVERQRYQYTVCRSLADFAATINRYLCNAK